MINNKFTIVNNGAEKIILPQTQVYYIRNNGKEDISIVDHENKVLIVLEPYSSITVKSKVTFSIDEEQSHFGEIFKVIDND